MDWLISYNETSSSNTLLQGGIMAKLSLEILHIMMSRNFKRLGLKRTKFLSHIWGFIKTAKRQYHAKSMMDSASIGFKKMSQLTDRKCAKCLKGNIICIHTNTWLIDPGIKGITMLLHLLFQPSRQLLARLAGTWIQPNPSYCLTIILVKIPLQGNAVGMTFRMTSVPLKQSRRIFHPLIKKKQKTSQFNLCVTLTHSK